MAYDIRSIRLEEFSHVYKNIEEDFASGEYAPYPVLYRQLEMSVQKGLILMENGRDVAYSICAEGRSNAFVLLSLLAVYKEYRGKGFGTEFLKILKSKYLHKKGIIAEVEKPEDAKSKKEREIRINRIAFYENAGFRLLTDIDYTIWEVPMYLMILPIEPFAFGENGQSTINQEVAKAMHEIYLELMGEQFIHKMVLKV